MKFKSVKTQLAFYFILVSGISLILSGLLSTSLITVYLYRSSVAEINHQSDIIAAELRRSPLPPPQLIRVTQKILQSQIYFVPNPRQALYPNRFKIGVPFLPVKGRKLIDWPALESGRRQIIRSYRPQTGATLILVAQPFRKGGRLLGAVILARPVRLLREAQSTIRTRLLIAGSLALLIAVIIAATVSEQLTNRIKKLVVAARRLAAGNYSHRLKVESNDELGELALTFNHMAREVERSDQSKKNFVAGVSHELRTPLTSIQGFAEALADQAIDNPQQCHQAAVIIKQESKRLGRLIEDLLNLAKLDTNQFSLNPKEINLMETMTNCCQTFAARAKEAGVSFETSLQGLKTAIIDEDRLIQVVGNLLDNALKFSPSGSTLNLSARQNQEIVIEITDSGPGISPDDLPHIFNRFYRSKDKRIKGMGLGLAVVKELTTAMGGKVEVVSPINSQGGSRFKLIFPSSPKIEERTTL
jgi:signal transduction histidine kinase